MSLLKHWRFVLLTLVAIAALAAFGACGDDDEGGEESPAATTPAAGERIQGGELTVHSVEFQSLDPHFSNFSQDIFLQRMLWRGLYMLDKDNKPQPMMAADAPDVSADGKTYTITLKDGLKWSDGEPLVAADFEAGIKRTCNPVVAGQYEYVLDASIAGCADFFAALNGPDEEAGTDDDLAPADADLPTKEAAVGVTATDDTTLEITLNQAQPTFNIILSLWMTFPVPTHLDRFANQTADAPADWGTDPAGLVYNGPYILQSYTQQDSVKLVPNPNWAGDIQPTLDTLTIKFIEDNAVADNAFRSGELDTAIADLAQLDALRTEFGDEFVSTPQPGTISLQMEMKTPPLDNEQVRLAISHAINRDELVSVVYGNAYIPTTTWLPESVGGVAPDFFDDQVGFDPDKAKQSLADAGYPDGEGFPTLKFTIRDTPTNQNLFAYLQAQFKEILNIDIEVEVVDGPTRSRKFNEHDFELFPGGWIQDYPDPENWIVGLFNTGGGNNGYECSDPDIDALIEAAQFNTDDEERLQQYKDINELIVTRLCGVASYYHLALNNLISSDIVGMAENTAGQDSILPGDWMAEAWGLAP